MDIINVAELPHRDWAEVLLFENESKNDEQ
jgi:hypothetical protein